MAKKFINQKSKESNKKQLKLSKKQGDAYLAAVKEMTSSEADSGKVKVAGDYLIGYAVEQAEGLYTWEKGKLVWENPKDENVHIEVAVADKTDGRFLPGLDVEVTLDNDSGQRVGKHKQPYLWHPWLYHYGRNWKIPEYSGLYSLCIEVAPPPYHRHDKVHGKRHAKPVKVVFKDIKIETGRKIS